MSKKNLDKEKRKKRSSRIVNAVLVLILMVGLSIMLYPTFSDWWNTFHQAKTIANYVQQIEETDEEEIEAMWAAADAYNAALRYKTNRYILSEEEKAEYNSVLDVTGTGIMGYVEIPTINVSLPIYHGTDEDVLQIAIGHIEGSSLPVGGLGTHSLLSGHRGLPSAKLFSDIVKLVEGDRFQIHVLGRMLTYQVDQIRTVLPNELQDLEIDPEKDYVTLITCTPYSINTHRLLVRGHRIENEKVQVSVPADAIRIEQGIVMVALGALILFILLIFMLLSTGHKRRKLRRRQRLLEEAFPQYKNL